jgi:hypothetical protein
MNELFSLSSTLSSSELIFDMHFWESRIGYSFALVARTKCTTRTLLTKFLETKLHARLVSVVDEFVDLRSLATLDILCHAAIGHSPKVASSV